jgi:hypothetical protein
VGQVVAALLKPLRGRHEVVVDARFAETNLHLRVEGTRRIDILKRIIDPENLSLSPSQEILYIGRKCDAERARRGAAVLRKAIPEAVGIPWCARTEPGHISTAARIPQWILATRVMVDVPASDCRGMVQAAYLGAEHKAADYYWLLVALSSTTLTNRNGNLSIVPASGIGSNDVVGTNTVARTYCPWR